MAWMSCDHKTGKIVDGMGRTVKIVRCPTKKNIFVAVMDNFLKQAEAAELLQIFDEYKNLKKPSDDFYCRYRE